MSDDLVPTEDERLEFYVGRDVGTCVDADINTRDDSTISSTFQSYDQYSNALRQLDGGYKTRNHEREYQRFLRCAMPIQWVLRSMGQDRVFRTMPEDGHQDFDIPTFCKSSGSRKPKKNRYILPLNYHRFFKMLANVEKADMPFEQKKDVLFWRGATTSDFDRPGRSSIIAQSNKFDPAEIDISYSNTCQTDKIIAQSGITEEVLLRHTKARVRQVKQLRFKFLLCLEGNDVASSLPWMLQSNSVILMPRPRAISWMCEPFLQPFVHYVPVKRDLSNLENRREWCLDHPKQCKEISENARAFLAPFLDRTLELRLFRAVVSRYLDSVAFDVDPKAQGRYFSHDPDQPAPELLNTPFCRHIAPDAKCFLCAEKDQYLGSEPSHHGLVA